MPLIYYEDDSGDILVHNLYSTVGLEKGLGLNHMMTLSASLDFMNLQPGSGSESASKKHHSKVLSIPFVIVCLTLAIRNL
ncbi:MAG: hypothetical protein MZV63_36885, partial [Marinilabiliales bacterium]|nr:hypothetical protein [Marinilabiliales bacterium]